MAIRHLEEAKMLRKQGERLGRAGTSQRIIKLVKEFTDKEGWEGNYFGAIELAGRLHAITLAARSNSYWDEKCQRGYTKELFDITKFEPTPVED